MSESQPSASAKKVLIIDDSTDQLDLMRDVLEDAGYTVVTRATARDVRQTVLDEQPDLLILDIVLKSSNGLNAVSQLKDDPDTRSVPILLCSGAPRLALVNTAVIAQANGLLSKPYAIDALLNDVRRLTTRPDAAAQN